MAIGDKVVLHYLADSDSGPFKVHGKNGKLIGSDADSEERKSFAHVACQPTRKTVGHDFRVTGVASVVTCEACKATDIWKEHYHGPATPALDAMPQVLIDKLNEAYPGGQ